MTTNVPSPSFGATGFQPASTPAILTGVEEDLNASFATTFDFNLNTPQGQLASSLAAIIANVQQLLAYYSTQTDPNYAEGRMQDAIGEIYGMTRNPAEPTQLTINCVGGGAGASVLLPGQNTVGQTPASISDPAG